MPPKKAAAKKKAEPKQKAQAKRKAEVLAIEEVPNAGQVTRGQQSNMLTQLKKINASDDQKKVLSMYQALGRFDPKKHELLRQWDLDKSCRWASSYEVQTVKETQNQKERVQGYGTE